MASLAERRFRCIAHGEVRVRVARGQFPARCPIAGCSRTFLRTWDGKPLPHAPAMPPSRAVRITRECEPDESLPPDEVRAGILRLLAEMPHGARRPTALALGFKGKWALHSARSIAKGRGHLYEAVRRRLSRRLHQFERGEFVLVPTGLSGPGKRLSGAIPSSLESARATARVGDIRAAGIHTG